MVEVLRILLICVVVYPFNILKSFHLCSFCWQNRHFTYALCMKASGHNVWFWFVVELSSVSSASAALTLLCSWIDFPTTTETDLFLPGRHFLSCFLRNSYSLTKIKPPFGEKKKKLSLSSGAVSAGKALASLAWPPEFSPQNPHTDGWREPT